VLTFSADDIIGSRFIGAFINSTHLSRKAYAG